MSSQPRNERRDPTFTNYSSSQAREYAQHRSGYPSPLIESILSHHAATGGKFGTLLDLGCGPGNSTQDLAPPFNHAIAIDPSEEMIKVARHSGACSKDGTPVDFITGSAESCGSLHSNTVDLITAAMSAHWFDMKQFWPTAARVLKPGGTVAFFNIYRMYCPPSMSHAAQVERILLELDFETLKPYTMPGNVQVMNGYKDLEMPWMMRHVCEAFEKSTYTRKVWNEDGKPEHDNTYMCGERVQTLEEAEKSIGTSSSVTRWREAHPALANTENDCVTAAFRKIRDILGPGGRTITTVGPTVLLMLKKQL